MWVRNGMTLAWVRNGMTWVRSACGECGMAIYGLGYENGMGRERMGTK